MSRITDLKKGAREKRLYPFLKKLKDELINLVEEIIVSRQLKRESKKWT